MVRSRSKPEIAVQAGKPIKKTGKVQGNEFTTKNKTWQDRLTQGQRIKEYTA